MCGRYNIKNAAALAALIESLTTERLILQPRYNIAPTQLNPVVRPHEAGGLTCREMRWGLVPAWEHAAKPKFAPINARSEEMMDKPTFRESVQHRRCAVPADGFYEWKRLDARTRAPFHIGLKAGAPFFMAGLYAPGTDTRPETYCLLTTGPNAIMGPIHDRMPVILTGENLMRWLRPGPLPAGEARALCQPYDPAGMVAWPVSSLVSKVANDGPECVEPVAPPELF